MKKAKSTRLNLNLKGGKRRKRNEFTSYELVKNGLDIQRDFFFETTKLYKEELQLLEDIKTTLENIDKFQK